MGKLIDCNRWKAGVILSAANHADITVHPAKAMPNEESRVRTLSPEQLLARFDLFVGVSEANRVHLAGYGTMRPCSSSIPTT